MKKISLIFLGLFIMAGCSNGSKTDTVVFSSTEQTTVKTNPSSSAVDNGLNTMSMTVDEAKKIYEEEYPNTAIVSIEIQADLGTYYFTIQGVDDTKMYELKINTSNSETYKEDEETLDQDDQNGVKKEADAIDFSVLKTLKEIVSIAESSSEGYTAVEADLEKDDGETYWEVTMKKELQEIEVKINAATGSIIQKDAEVNTSSTANTSSSELQNFEEYSKLNASIDLSGTTVFTETDNAEKRVLLFTKDNQKLYKSIFIKSTQFLKIVDLKNNDVELFYGKI